MALMKSIEVDNRSIPVKYWRVWELKRFNPHIKICDVVMAGYFTEESRKNAGDDQKKIDILYEFTIRNWTEEFRKERPATVDEKRAFFDPTGQKKFTIKQLNEKELVKEEVVPVVHNDFDTVYEELIKGDWKKGIYKVLLNGEYSKETFKGATEQ